jgi:hypothetical protein
MRVGPDTGSDHIGAPHASRLWFLNGRVWWNDPDCVSVRAATPLEQARLNASFTTIAGDLFYNSDWMPDFPPERLDILRRCIPSHNLAARPVDVFENEPARIWHLPDTRTATRRDIVALYNWGKDAATIACPVDRLGLPPAREYVGFDFWGNRFIPPFKDEVRAELPPGGSCRILAIRPVAAQPQVLSTSRHITQGMMDLANERWDPAQSRLAGASQLVANDPYELRIVVPTGEKSWRAIDVSVAAEDQAAGVTAAFQQDGPKLRVTLASATSRTVNWQVRFAPGAVAARAPQPVKNLKAVAEYRQVLLSWDDSGAEGYRVTSAAGATALVSGAKFADTAFPHGKPLSYRVEAMGWDGQASAPATISMEPLAQLKAPALPPLPTVYLDDLKPRIAENGWGQAAIGKSVSGKALLIEKKRYEKGIGLHAKGLVICPVPAGAVRFVAVVGLDDAKLDDERTSVVFEVYGDVKEMGEPPVRLGQSPVISPKTLRAWSFNLELNARHKELRLVVTDAGDGIAADHANWVNAGFIMGK